MSNRLINPNGQMPVLRVFELERYNQEGMVSIPENQISAVSQVQHPSKPDILQLFTRVHLSSGVSFIVKADYSEFCKLLYRR